MKEGEESNDVDVVVVDDSLCVDDQRNNPYVHFPPIPPPHANAYAESA